MNNTRRTAAFVVAKWMATKTFPQTMLPDGADRAFVQDVVYTVIRRLRVLRKALGGFVKVWPKGELEALLYVGAAQILYMDDVPDFAAVNETVEAAKVCANPSIVKVVNAVLRNLVRNKAAITVALAKESLEVRESYPTALVRRWRVRYGDEGAEALAKWHNAPAETFLARKDGSFVKLERGKRINDVEGFAEGDFIVQDPGTAAAVELLNVQPGEMILDACAAPGGKTVQIAWRGALTVACEVNSKRRGMLMDNLRRLKLDVKVVSAFEAAAKQASDGFDKVLADVPCSNSGVLKRRPDARWNWTEERMLQLVALQAEILDELVPMVKSGGTLVYSTCSNEPEENQLQVEAFIRRHREFSLVEVRESVPYKTGHDGAFAALLTKK